jgi:hypothetical protein
MFQWLRKAFDGTKRFLGKVKGGIEGGVRLFNKGKEIYGGVKNFASNLPIVGTVAGNAINNFENRANEAVKSRIGVDFKDINKAVSTAETVAKYLPRG